MIRYHDPGRRRVVCSVLSAIAIIAAVPGAALAAVPVGDGFIFQKTSLPTLADSRRYVLQGKRLGTGRCHYDYPEVRLPDSAAVWEVRDVALDPTDCRKLVEEGVPPESDQALQPGDGRIAGAIPDAASSPTTVTASAAASTASGYNWTWWEDVIGIKVNQDRTNISWSFSGGCNGAGSTSGEWYWAYGTGWEIVSYSGSEYESCSYYRGTTVSHFRNAAFCWPLPTVHTYYYYVSAYGFADGSVAGTRSTDSVDECAPLWMHYQVRKVT